MHSMVKFVKAGFWFAAFAARGFNHRRLMAWTEAKLAPMVLIPEPVAASAAAPENVDRNSACLRQKRDRRR